MGLAQDIYNAVQAAAVGVSAGTVELSNNATISAQHTAQGDALTFQGSIPVSESFDATAGVTTYTPDDTSMTTVTP